MMYGQDGSQQHLGFDKRTGCNRCGRTVNDDDGTKVTWMCCVCNKLVCRHCTLIMPKDHPDHNDLDLDQYYDDTYCSADCHLIDYTEERLLRGGGRLT